MTFVASLLKQVNRKDILNKYKDRKKIKKEKRYDFFKNSIYPLFIKRLELSFLHMAFADIKKASVSGVIIGAFILCSCYIDYLAYYFSPRDNVGIRYKDFIKKYLASYDPERLYKDLRCKIVHNYSEGGSYIFTHGDPKDHLKLNSNYNKIYINLNNFIKDLEHATNHFLSDLHKDENMILEAVKSFKLNPLLGLYKKKSKSVA